MPMNFSGRTVSGGWVVVGAIGIAAALGACGSSGGGQSPSSQFKDAPDGGGGLFQPSYEGGLLSLGAGGDGAVASLAFDPPSATLTLDGTTPQSASFTLQATLADGTKQTVSAQSIQFDRPDLATMTPGAPVVLTAGGQAAGVGNLHAVYDGVEATAQLTVVVQMIVTGTGVTPGQVATLNGTSLPADPSLTSLQYPYDKTVFPLGLASPLVMWAAPNANDVYRIHLEETNFTFDGYYAVAQPAQQAIDQTTWDSLTASNAGDPLKLQVDRLDVATNTAYASASESWTIAAASLRGAIYYWTTSGTGHMSRIYPGQGSQPEVLNSGVCMGCHAVSADGTTLVAVVDADPSTDNSDPADGTSRAWVNFALPAATPAVTSTSFGGNLAVNPDGKFVVYGDRQLQLGDTSTGLAVPTSGMASLPLDPSMLGFMDPAFSPDGTKLAMVEGGQGVNKSAAWYHNLYDGNLVIADFSETNKTVGNLVHLAPASFFPSTEQGIAYPSFAPDSQSIAFHVGDYTTGCDEQGCDANATQIGAIWLQNVNGTNPVRLASLTDSSLNTADHDLSFEPTFNPVDRGGYFWVVFTSSRDWGNRITGTPNNGKKRLWVAAIDKTGTVDPSHPAFFLQGQEEDTTNMRGFWSLAQCTPTPAAGAGGGTCAAGFECCSGFCDQGTCVDTGAVACQGTGGTCMTAADCCNSSVVSCVGGACVAQAPK